MPYLRLLLICIHVQEYANASRQPSWYGYLCRTEQGYIVPTEAARSASRIFAADVRRNGKDRAHDVVYRHVVGGNDRFQQLAGGRKDGF